MKHCAIFSTILFSLLFTSCHPRVFGVDEAVWNTLNEPERTKVIEGYNRRRETELANQQKEREKELDNQRHRQELDAQNAPFYAAADIVSSICQTDSKEKRSYGTWIQSLSSKHGRQTVTIRDESFEVSWTAEMSDAWLKGQQVEVLKNDDLLYPVTIKNLENGESVHARKKKHS